MYVDKFDENKRSLPGIKIFLLKDGSIVKTGFTPVLFEDLPKGTYVVRETIPEGYEATGPTEYEFTIVDEHLFHNYTFKPFFIPEPEFHKNQRFVKANSSGNIYPGVSHKTIPSWNVFGRPTNAKIGTIGFNSQTSDLEIWNGSIWFKLSMKKVV